MEENEEPVTDEDEDEWYLRRVEAGLAALQTADYVLAWVCMEDDGVSFNLLLSSRTGAYIYRQDHMLKPSYPENLNHYQIYYQVY